jgi:hypothetical protein
MRDMARYIIVGTYLGYSKRFNMLDVYLCYGKLFSFR